MDKFVWGITDTNPYSTKELKFIENGIIEGQDEQNNEA